MLKKPWIYVAGGLLVIGGTIAGYHAHAQAASAAKHDANSPAVAVVTGKVEQRDTPIYLDGIGTVAASNTVTVRPRIDGQLESVAFREGQDVKAGDLLATLDARALQAQLDQANAKKAQDNAQLANAETDLKRDLFLAEKALIDQQAVDTQKALVAQLKALVQSDEAAVENAAVQLSYARITAPLSGRVGLRLVDAGNLVHASDAAGLVVITQLRPISVVFTLPQQNLTRLHQAAAATENLKVIAYDHDNRVPLDEGEVTVVDNQIDPTTGTIKVKATFPNEKLALWPGQFVNVRLLVDTRKDGIVVPSAVVQRGPKGSYAFVIRDDQTAEVRAIEVAQIDDGRALITAGLAPGETVVVDGQYKLQAGSRVTLASADGGSGEHRRPQKRSE
jgi:multidrug efflux system membrane fusion protein